MNYKEIAETEPFTAKTPFHMNPGWELLLENSNKTAATLKSNFAAKADYQSYRH